MSHANFAWPDPLHTGTYRLEIISGACAKRVWPRETGLVTCISRLAIMEEGGRGKLSTFLSNLACLLTAYNSNSMPQYSLKSRV